MTQPNYGHYPSTGPIHPAQPTPPKKSRKGLWISLGVVGAMLAACLIGCTALLASSADGPKPAGDKAISTSAPAAKSTSAAPTSAAPAPAKPVAATPKPADFKLTVKLLDKQCFGSAGCLVDYRISNVSYSGPALDPNSSYEITYKVTGLQDPKVSTFTLNGDGSYSVDERESGQTSSSSKVIKAAVTDVEAV